LGGSKKDANIRAEGAEGLNKRIPSLGGGHKVSKNLGKATVVAFQKAEGRTEKGKGRLDHSTLCFEKVRKSKKGRGPYARPVTPYVEIERKKEGGRKRMSSGWLRK